MQLIGAFWHGAVACTLLGDQVPLLHVLPGMEAEDVKQHTCPQQGASRHSTTTLPTSLKVLAGRLCYRGWQVSAQVVPGLTELGQASQHDHHLAENTIHGLSIVVRYPTRIHP